MNTPLNPPYSFPQYHDVNICTVAMVPAKGWSLKSQNLLDEKAERHYLCLCQRYGQG